MSGVANTAREPFMRAEKWRSLIRVAAAEVFGMMLNSELEQVDELPERTEEVTAVIGLAGALCGVFTVRCSARASVLMTARMLGTPADQVDQETWDAVGEVCNMVAGNFKSKLDGVGDGCMLSIPTVVSGADYAVRSLANGERVQQRFLFEGEPVCIALDLES